MGLSQTESMLSFVLTRSDCHLNIIVIYYIKIDHVLLTVAYVSIVVINTLFLISVLRMKEAIRMKIEEVKSDGGMTSEDDIISRSGRRQYV